MTTAMLDAMKPGPSDVRAARASQARTSDSQSVHAASPPAVPPFWGRMRKAAGALAVLMRDHGRLDQVLAFTQAVNGRTLSQAVVRFGSTPEGRRLFTERPRIDREHVDFDALRRLPDGTLGREYTRFLDENGITPDAFEKLPEGVDERVAWIMLRLRQTHDLWHVLTGYRPDVRGEVLLQAFTSAHIGAPSAAALAFFGSVRWLGLTRAHVRDLREAYARGKATTFLATFPWEEHWSTPVAELRRRLTCPDLS